MARGSGNETRTARLDDVEPGLVPAPVARWEVFGAEPAPEGAADAAAPVAAFTDPDVDDGDGGSLGDPAAVADLASAVATVEATVASDLAAASESRLAVAGRTARLGDASRAGGRDRSRPDTGPGGELVAPPRRPRDDGRPRPRSGASAGTGHATSTDPTSAADTAQDIDRAPPPRRVGPKQIDPDDDPVAAAREICLRLLTDRARTRHELAQALSRRGVPDDAAASVLERFDDVGLIDDAAFAGQWVRSRHNHRGLSRRAIAMELRRKGVDDEVASEALEEVDADSEARRARELVDRKLRTLTVDTSEQRTTVARRLVGMLARKGYGAGIAYRVVREALAAHGADSDELGTEPADD